MTRRPQLLLTWALVGLGAAALLYTFPLVRVVPLSQRAEAGARFDPPAFALRFWEEQLQPAAARATELERVLPALERDPRAAAVEHGHQVGVGGSAYFFVRGSGRVVAMERDRLLLAPDAFAPATIALRTGPVFGNTVRDGCGLLEVNDAPGLQEFNALSAALNELVEQRVLPALRGDTITVGTRVSFAGCAVAPEAVGAGPLLIVVPVRAEVAP